jgi:hypothetical protein
LDNNITKDGVVRQVFNCGKGKQRFSETGYCDLFKKEKRGQTPFKIDIFTFILFQVLDWACSPVRNVLKHAKL